MVQVLQAGKLLLWSPSARAAPLGVHACAVPSLILCNARTPHILQSPVCVQADCGVLQASDVEHGHAAQGGRGEDPGKMLLQATDMVAAWVHACHRTWLE